MGHDRLSGGSRGAHARYGLGVLGTTVSTVLCGLAWSMESLIAFRVVQGVAGASVMSIGMVMLYEAFPAEPHSSALQPRTAENLR